MVPLTIIDRRCTREAELLRRVSIKIETKCAIASHSHLKLTVIAVSSPLLDNNTLACTTRINLNPG
ncbi:hypothetical protein Rhal01_03781 [Rubritalea halochordaticola]|uniref:Uncharacterized protein n=1 Tax=Rubritalea halochordaticola TaxID=714537 RepID=A0ABP9V6G6_9BACT